MTRTTPQAHISRPFLLTLALGAFLLMVLPTPVVHAATITVNDTSGGTGGPSCKLRDAITAANTNGPVGGCAAGSGDDIIDLPAGVIITLTDVDNGGGTVNANGLPVIASNITINGNNATIQRSTAGGIPDFRIFHVTSGDSLTLNSVTIRNGRTATSGSSAGMGGGIASFGTVVLNNSTVTVNRTGNGTGGHGGGIASTGTLTITISIISDNTAGQGGVGGGIYGSNMLSISNSAVSGNTVGAGSGGGGGIYNNSGATMNLTNTWISNNTAGNSTSGGDGGGIYNGSSVTANITNSSISGNTAGNGSSSNGGSGGGIYQTSGTLTLTNTTISGNTAGNGTSPGMGGRGGGIYNGGTLVLTNSTLSGNATGTPSGDGGGILNYGTLDVTSSTIANNTAAWNGGGIKTNTATASVRNTIVANNTAISAPSYANCAGAITNGGNNLDNGTSCGWGSASGSMSNTDPLLGALAWNGGSTLPVLALLVGSPAIDGVTWTPPNSSPSTDERGVARPQGARHDIGAYEAVFITVNDTSGGTGAPGCKLRDAITAANTDAPTGACSTGVGPDIIVLPARAKITLSVVDNGTGINTNGLPIITGAVTISGNDVFIERSTGGGIPGFRIFEVEESGNLTLNNVTIRNGRAPDSTLPGQPGGFGGGILSFGTLNVNNSTVSGNRTGDGSWGGIGGGIYIAGGSATITNSTISGNSTGNGSIGNGGRGAGIYANVFLTLTNSTITGNVTGTPNGVGGGVETGSSSVSVTSSTIANNSAGLSGAGIRSGGAGTTLRNTIVANNTASMNENCDSAVTNGGNNLDSGTSCNWGSTNGSLSSTNPFLGPLGNYGGPTQTLPLGTGSPAIDGVTYNAPNNSPSTDQRGFARPHGVRHDIGAYEWYPPTYLPAVIKNSP